MKRLVASCAILMHSLFAHAQQDPVHWTFQAEKAGANTYKIHVTAAIDPGWHVYAQTQPKEAISVPTKIKFNANPIFSLQGHLQEAGKRETYTDKIAGITQYQYAGTVVYTQLLCVRGKARITLTGTVTYQACTSEMCLPEKTIPFNIPIP